MSVTVTTPASATLSETFTYLVTVSNPSSHDAANVVLTDSLPPGLAVQSVIPVQGVCDNAITCQMGTLAGGTMTIQINAMAATSGSITSTVSVSCNQPDPNPSNNVASVVLPAQANNSNLPPSATDDFGESADGTPVTINVLANDSDPNGDPFTISLESTSPGGVVTVNLDNTISFTPDPGFNGVYQSAYNVSDGKGGNASANVQINVTQLNTDKPVKTP